MSEDVGESDDNEAERLPSEYECLGMGRDVKLKWGLMGDGDRNEENLSSHLFVKHGPSCCLFLILPPVLGGGGGGGV